MGETVIKKSYPDQVSHQNQIGTVHLYSEMTSTTNRCRYDGWMPLHEVGRRIPLPQGFNKERYHPNTLYAQCVVDKAHCGIRILYDIPRSD